MRVRHPPLVSLLIIDTVCVAGLALTGRFGFFPVLNGSQAWVTSTNLKILNGTGRERRPPTASATSVSDSRARHRWWVHFHLFAMLSATDQ
jgi:hypothetical protein